MSLAIMSRLIDSFPAVHIKAIGMLYSSCWGTSFWPKVTEHTDFATERRNYTLISTSTPDQIFLYLYLHLSNISPQPSLLHFPCNPSPSVLTLLHCFPMHRFIRESGCGRQISSATSRYVLAAQAWSLIQRDQGLATQHLFRTMSLPACQQQVARLAGISGEVLVPVTYKQCQTFTCTRN